MATNNNRKGIFTFNDLDTWNKFKFCIGNDMNHDFNSKDWRGWRGVLTGGGQSGGECCTEKDGNINLMDITSCSDIFKSWFGWGEGESEELEYIIYNLFIINIYYQLDNHYSRITFRNALDPDNPADFEYKSKKIFKNLLDFIESERFIVMALEQENDFYKNDGDYECDSPFHEFYQRFICELTPKIQATQCAASALRADGPLVSVSPWGFGGGGGVKAMKGGKKAWWAPAKKKWAAVVKLLNDIVKKCSAFISPDFMLGGKSYKCPMSDKVAVREIETWASVPAPPTLESNVFKNPITPVMPTPVPPAEFIYDGWNNTKNLAKIFPIITNMVPTQYPGYNNVVNQNNYIHKNYISHYIDGQPGGIMNPSTGNIDYTLVFGSESIEVSLTKVPVPNTSPEADVSFTLNLGVVQASSGTIHVPDNNGLTIENCIIGFLNSILPSSIAAQQQWNAATHSLSFQAALAAAGGYTPIQFLFAKTLGDLSINMESFIRGVPIFTADTLAKAINRFLKSNIRIPPGNTTSNITLVVQDTNSGNNITPLPNIEDSGSYFFRQGKGANIEYYGGKSRKTRRKNKKTKNNKKTKSNKKTKKVNRKHKKKNKRIKKYKRNKTKKRSRKLSRRYKK